MKTIQEIRVVLFGIMLDIQAAGESRELALAITYSQNGRMLLGKTLGLLGEASPYPQADNPTSSVVAPAADLDTAPRAPLPADPIAAVKTIRAEIEPVLVRLAELRREQWARVYGTLAEAVFDHAYVELTLAKLWLGMELSRLATRPAPAAPEWGDGK